MLMIRLKRTGRTNDPSFKIVVGEKIYSPKSGKHLAYLGSYNPKTKATVIDADAVKNWISKGAQMSGTVNNLFINKGIIQGKKVNVLPKKTVPKKEEVAEAPKAPEPVAEAPEAAPEEVAAEPVAEATQDVKAE
jgi:small subunit ribosomal protein S16